MEKDTKGKRTRSSVIKILIVILALAVSGTVGVYAYNRLVKPERREALKLLYQAPERLSWSAQRDYLGTEEMFTKFLEDGGQMDVSISDISPKAGILTALLGMNQKTDDIAHAGLGMTAGWELLSDYTIDWNEKIDTDSGRTSRSVLLGKGEDEISIIRCQDDDEVWISLPELLTAKVFHAKSGDMDSILGESANSRTKGQEEKEFLTFMRDCDSFFRDEAARALEDVSYERIRGREDLDYIDFDGYAMHIPEETVNTFFQDFSALLKEQEGEVFQAAAKDVANYSVARDITVEIYGESGVLRQMEAEIPIRGKVFRVSLSFTGEKGDSAVAFLAQGEWEEEPVALSIKVSDKKKDFCETTVEVECLVDEETVAKAACTEKISLKDSSYQLHLNLDADGASVYQVKAKGTLKDLKKGSSVSLLLDDLELSAGGMELLTMSAKIQFMAGDVDVIPPQGDLIEITKDTGDEDMEIYRQEMKKNLKEITSRMGILKFFEDRETL